MALTDTKLQRLQARERPYQLADGGGLYVEVQPTGKKAWRMQYRLGGRGSRKERVTLGEYPAHIIAHAHEQKGVRGVYNKAEYLAQRRDMLQWWANLVDAHIEEGRKVVIARFGKAFQAA